MTTNTIKQDRAFFHAAWVLCQLYQGINPDHLDARGLGEPWGEGARVFLEHGKASFESWASQEKNGGGVFLPAVFRFRPGDPDPALEDVRTKTHWTMAELLAAEFPDPKWATPEILPVGLSSLAGRPKVGKSWLGLQFAQAVGTGGRALGHQVDAGKVLYLGLEDSARRLQDRSNKQRCPAGANIELRTTWPTFGDGGLTNLIDAITKGGFTLVVLDTLSRALGRADQMDIGQMTVILGELQQAAHLHECAILTIDHHRKAGAFDSDPIDDIMGSTAKAAICDAVLGLYKERGKQGAVLKVTGRDLAEQELALEWDMVTYCWHSLGDATLARQSDTRQAILDAIEELTDLGETPTSTHIAEHIDKDRSYVAKEIANLLNAGLVVKGEKQGQRQPYELSHT